MEWGIIVTAFYLVGALVLAIAATLPDPRPEVPPDLAAQPLPERIPDYPKAA